MMVLFRQKSLEAARAAFPLVALVSLLQFSIVQAPVGVFLQLLVGSALTIIGVVLLFTGIELGILPMGRFIGAELPRRGSLALILGITFALGFATTVAEPDVLVLAGQVDAASQKTVSGQALVCATALGVATLAMVAMARAVLGWPMRFMLAAVYGLALALAVIGPGDFAPLAFDAGSVTTGILSAPTIMAMAIGISSVLAGRSTVSDGFGILGIASVGPIIAILLLALLLS